MRPVLWIGYLAAVAGWVWTPAPAAPVSFDERHRQELAANPVDLHCVLRTTTASTKFHRGELIPITLDFSADFPDRYKLDAATYDRSGRLYSDEFVLDRDDAIDPLAEYFGSGVMGGMAGGIRGVPVLGPQPVGVDLRLNDWFRFDKPGRYRLFVKSHRLTRERLPGEAGETRVIDFAAVSNILDIDILPADPIWEARKLAELQAMLDESRRKPVSAARLTSAGQNWPSDAEMEAHRQLGYLGTRGALQLLLSKVRENVNNLAVFGLIRSPHRAFAISELDRVLEDPNAAIEQWQIRLRALFTYLEQNPQPLMPATAAEIREMDWKKLQPEAEKRRLAYDGVLERLAARLIPVIARKSVDVREDSVQAIASVAPERAKAAGLVPPDDYGMSRREFIAAFTEFSEERRSALLSSKWGLVRGPEMVPVLLSVIDAAPGSPAMTLNLWHGPTNVAEQALDRLQELAPEEATRILREDVGQPEPRFANMALHELPPQDIPAVDALVSNKLKANQIPPLPLAARYASRQVLKPMQQVHAGMKHLACEPEASFVTYFVRVDATIGKRVLSDAMASRERRGCFRSLLGHVAGVVWNPVVERAALAGLDDPDSGVASDAARVLSIHGGPAAEEALWSHLEKWSERWRGKANQLEAHPITREDPNRTEREYGNSLFSAVEQARGWIIDEARAHRLATLYIDDWNRDRLSHYKFGPVRIDAANGGAIYGKVFNFGQYRLGRFEDVKSKMAQYPAGTVFQWCSAPYGDGFVKEELQEMFDQLKRFGAERGLRVEPCSEKEQ